MTERLPLRTRIARLSYPALAAWMCICGFIYRDIPPSPDDALLDYMGWMLLRGGVQYVDFIDMNWPGGAWLHALSTWLFGVNLWSWRILDFLLMLPALLVGGALVGRAYGAGAKLWLWFTYPALYITLGVWMPGTRDAVAGHACIIVLALHALAWERQHLRFQALAGVVLGAAILVKPTIGFAGPVLMIHGIFASLRGAGLARAAVHTLVAATSTAVTLALALLFQLEQGASLEAVVEGAYVLNRLGHQLARVETRSYADGVIDVFGRWLHWVTAFGVLGLSKLLFERRRSLANRLLLLVPIVSGLASYAVQDKYFQYHLMPALFGVVALASVALADLSERAGGKSRALNALAVATIGIAVAGTFYKVARAGYPVFRHRAFDQGTEVEHYRRFRETEVDYGSVIALAERIRRTVPPEETVLMWGSENAINYLAERQQPTRFHHYVVLTYAKPPLPMAEKWNRWFTEDLDRNRPALCVVNVRALALAERRGVDSHDILVRFLEAGYVRSERIDELEIYTRRDLYRPSVE